MHLGCCAYSYRDALNGGQMTLSDFLHRCDEMGLDGVELTAYYFKDLSAEALHSIKREAYRLGLDVCGTAVGDAFTSPDVLKRREQIRMVTDWIDRSVILGAPCVRVFAGSVGGGATEAQAFDWTVECLKECASYGRERGIMVALENHGGITATADQVIRLVEAVSDDWLGINLDLGNYQTNPYDEIARTVPYAVTAHAKVTAAGQTLDYDRIVQVLHDAGYRGYINVEYEEPEDPMEGVPVFIRQLQNAVANVRR